MIRCIILAGGSGKRLWPISNAERPKQLLTLGEQTLFKATVERALLLTHAEHCTAVTITSYLSQLYAEAPDITYLIEPHAHNTGPAYCFALQATKQDHDDTILVGMPADHYIPDTQAWHNALKLAIKNAQESHKMVLLGAQPTRPAPEYGYIQTGKSAGANGATVTRFCEKPTATEIVHYAPNEWWWHTGIWVATRRTVHTFIIEHAPELWHRLCTENYADILPISWDHLILEKVYSHCLLVPLNTSWYDVGSPEQFLLAQKIYLQHIL